MCPKFTFRLIPTEKDDIEKGIVNDIGNAINYDIVYDDFFNRVIWLNFSFKTFLFKWFLGIKKSIFKN